MCKYLKKLNSVPACARRGKSVQEFSAANSAKPQNAPTRKLRHFNNTTWRFGWSSVSYSKFIRSAYRGIMTEPL